MTLRFSRLLALSAVACAASAQAQITFYEHDGFRGRSLTTQESQDDLARRGFNDRVSSIVVGGSVWQVCENADYGGRCVSLRPGNYASLSALGLNDRVSSAREQRGEHRNGEFSRRGNERLYEANVTSVRAVVGPPQQRCWIEQEQVMDRHPQANVPGALIGALIGGVLGHQVGGGSGRQLATAGGVVAGAAIGSQVGRDNQSQQASTQNVQRCAAVPGSGQPEYWDVSYRFRGQDHQMQTRTAPGHTVTVNRQGEPRG